MHVCHFTCERFHCLSFSHLYKRVWVHPMVNYFSEISLNPWWIKTWTLTPPPPSFFFLLHSKANEQFRSWKWSPQKSIMTDFMVWTFSQISQHPWWINRWKFTLSIVGLKKRMGSSEHDLGAHKNREIGKKKWTGPKGCFQPFIYTSYIQRSNGFSQISWDTWWMKAWNLTP